MPGGTLRLLRRQPPWRRRGPRAALAAPGAPRPYFLSDTGDNPTAGGAGDVTWTLAQLLASKPPPADADVRLVHASIFYAGSRGPGGRRRGGRRSGHLTPAPAWMTTRTAPRPALRGTVYSITHGDPTAGTQAVIAVGNVFAILTQNAASRSTTSAHFTQLGLDPDPNLGVIVVKIGYLEPELYNAARRGGSWR